MEDKGMAGEEKMDGNNSLEKMLALLHLEVASTVQCTTPKTKDEKDATKGACVATW